MKNILILVLAGSSILGSQAIAQSTNTLAADIGAGKKRAGVCFACHGENGIAKIPGTPHLAGQQVDYLISVLEAYKNGQGRTDPTMSAMAKPLSSQDILNIAAYYSLQVRMNDAQTAAQAQQILERIRPVAVSVSYDAQSTETKIGEPEQKVRSGEQIYTSVCMACHDTGAAGAPKMGDKLAWKTKIAEGEDKLVKHAIEGYNAMPPKGGCADCTDTEIKAAVEYLIQKSE